MVGFDWLSGILPYSAFAAKDPPAFAAFPTFTTANLTVIQGLLTETLYLALQ